MNVRWYYVAISALAILLLIMIAAMVSNFDTAADNDVLYQVSAMDLLMNGSYDGIITAGDLKRHGDFGMGTFQGLDGEMIVLDGAIYQVTSYGAVNAMNDTSMIPYAAVTYFDTDTSVRLDGPNNLSMLTTALDNKFPSDNVFYAIRIHGTFPYLKARSVPAQAKPYPRLPEVIKNQSVFDLHDVTGTIVGIYSPRFTNGVQAPGYHLHFIADDHKSGGHVLDFTADDMNVQLDSTPRFYMALS